MTWVWNAFQHLSTCRSIGMGVGPIPWTAIDDYAWRHRILDIDDFEELRYLVMAMDETYLTHMNTKRPVPVQEKPK